MIHRRSLLFLALAILFGAGAAFAARSYIAERTTLPVVEPPKLAPVATAAREVPAGRSLGAQDVLMVEWPLEHVPGGAVADANRLLDRVVSRAVSEGEPLLESALLPEGSAAGLPALISPDHRAVSVKVDAVIGVAGFVQPGARVDVLATFRNTSGGNFSNVILQDVRVLAVDQTMDSEKDGAPKVVNVATLEVDPNEAERLVHSAHEGRLQLALRGPGDDEVLTTRAIRAEDLLGKKPAKPKVARKRGSKMQVIKGTAVSDEAY
jgi:pilus assembly protein CpaB